MREDGAGAPRPEGDAVSESRAERFARLVKEADASHPDMFHGRGVRLYVRNDGRADLFVARGARVLSIEEVRELGRWIRETYEPELRVVPRRATP